MKLKDIFLNYFKDLEEKVLEIEKAEKNQYNLVIDKFYDNNLFQLEDILNKKETKVIKDYLKNDIINILKNNIKEINKLNDGIINDMLKSTKDIVTSNIKNHIFNINVSEIAIKECKTKVSNINVINKEFLKKFDNQFELFFYNLSIEYKLKNDINLYNLISKTINQNKKILLDNFKEIEDLKKEEIINLYSSCFNNFSREIKDLKENTNKKNNSILLDYQEKILSEKVNSTVSETVKNSNKKIEKILYSCHYQILKYQKSRNLTDKETDLKFLYNYLINFNNTLFDKSLNILNKMISVVSLNKEDLEVNIKKYNDIIYKICDFEYNFDKQFLLYRQKMLNRKYFITQASVDKIIELIEEAKKEIISVIKVSVIELFKENVNSLNMVSYKILMSDYKLENCYETIDENMASKLL